MAEKQNRWFVSGVLIVAVVALVGVSILPLLQGVFEATNNGNPTTPAASPSVSPAAQQSDLQAQARGYELVLQREPENQTALKGLVEARLQLRDIPGVVAPLEKLAKLNPQDTRLSVLLAQSKQYTGDREGAAQVYRGILTSKPGELNALDGLVTLLLEQQRPEAAIGLLQDTLKAAPQANQIQANAVDVTSVQVLLGRVYAQQKQYADAIAVFDAAIESSPQDFRPVVAKAIVLKDQGKTTEADPLFTKATALAPAQFKDQIKQLASGVQPSPVPGNPAPSNPGSTLSPANPSSANPTSSSSNPVEGQNVSPTTPPTVNPAPFPSQTPVSP